MTTIAEVAEHDAAGRVAALYADIRNVSGTPLVNLVYRHLATDPDMLDWAWQAMRPHFLSGALAAQAASLRRRAGHLVSTWPMEAAAVGGVRGLDDAIRLILTYNRANSVNLMALTHLLQPRDSALVDAACEQPASVKAEALPRLPALAELPEAEQARIHRLNAFAEPDTPVILASLYRHLAVWPEVLPVAERLLAPLDRAGLLAHARATVCDAARRIATERPLAMPAAPPEFTRRFGARLGRLAEVTISKMIPIGAALAASLQAAVDQDRLRE